ncbi:unnamed protein product [Rotaria socialis]|uniref:CCHC-type domain-containing protein n=1 Tax=Rotaria socialis TaxID=392032 RepID=A0A818T6H7_9BILA|nr:unnamed protein product [Rotaria socialis]CAF4642696.1 unnamed protein product [Rotaria socialis]
MSGAFSSVVNFTTDQFLKRAGKLSVLTDLENQSESGQLGCPLQFPKHHKRRRKVAALKKSVSNTTIDLPRNDTIKKIIHQAYNDAYKLLSELDINIALEKKKKTKINEVSSYVRTQFEKKFKKVTYDEGEIYSSNDESDEEVATNVNSSSKPEEDSSEDENDLPCISSSVGISVPVLLEGRLKVCYRCKESGHVKSECNKLKCQICYEIGHDDPACNKQRTYANVASTSTTPLITPRIDVQVAKETPVVNKTQLKTCYRCKQPGHVQKDCIFNHNGIVHHSTPIPDDENSSTNSTPTFVDNHFDLGGPQLITMNDCDEPNLLAKRTISYEKRQQQLSQ